MRDPLYGLLGAIVIMAFAIAWLIYKMEKITKLCDHFEDMWDQQVRVNERLFNSAKSQQELIEDQLSVRKELYKKLADPNEIQRQMEASSDVREMRDASRSTLPRENAGPAAVMHKPQQIGVSMFKPHQPPPSPRR